MSDRLYRQAFFLAVVACVVLAATVGYLLLHRGGATVPMAQAGEPVVARGPSTGQQSASPSAGQGNASGTEPQLATIQLTPQRMQQIGVTMAVAEMKDVTDKLSVPGNVDINEQRLAYVQTRFAGWVQNVFANATYQYVNKGQKLFTIYSPELVSTEQEYLLAKENQKLLTPGSHDVAAKESGWLLDAADERLRQFGVSAEEVARLQQSGKAQREIMVYSPATGFITERSVLPNAYVQPEMKLYTIADLSTVWVYANVFQDAVGRLKPGDAAKVTVDAYPGREFHGHIDQILPQVDEATRTVKVRLVFRNPGVVLKPGMFVNVDINVPLGRQLVVPSSAVLQSGTQAIAFIDRGQGNLEPRAIETGAQAGDSIVVLKGLQAGDHVVNSANFLVDSEAQLQAALGAFSTTEQGANVGAAQAMVRAAKAEQIRVEMTTQPGSPQKGKNTVRVQLMGQDGKPMDGMQVSASFVLPAMPAMGMAAEHASAALSGKGQGMYEGPLELPSGGTWQVSVIVRRAGNVIATKKLSIDATGGME